MSSADPLDAYRAPGPYGPAGEIVPKHQVLLQFEAHTSLREALERMLEEGYTLAPVCHHGRTVGVLSVQSALRQLLADPLVQAALTNRTAGEQIEGAVFVPAERWVDTDFDWQGDTAALVGDADRVLGIITHADLLRRVDDFARAFLVIAEIEMAFRMVLETLLPWSAWEPEYQRIFDAATNRTGDQYKPKKPDELTYWHYEMVLRDPRCQELLAPHVIVPCVRLAEMTKTARLIRNDVMHFRRPANGDMVENLERLRLQLQAALGSILRQRVAQAANGA
jgi:CBS domain-containing protein